MSDVEKNIGTHKPGFDCCRETVCCGVLFSSMSASLLCT